MIKSVIYCLRLKVIFCQISITTSVMLKFKRSFEPPPLFFVFHLFVHTLMLRFTCLSCTLFVSPLLSVCIPLCMSVRLSLHSLTGLRVVRLSGHYMRHLFARCYCLHGGDFIRCCDNFINLGGKSDSLSQRRRKWRGKGGFGT